MPCKTQRKRSINPRHRSVLRLKVTNVALRYLTMDDLRTRCTNVYCLLLCDNKIAAGEYLVVVHCTEDRMSVFAVTHNAYAANCPGALHDAFAGTVRALLARPDRRDDPDYTVVIAAPAAEWPLYPPLVVSLPSAHRSCEYLLALGQDENMGRNLVYSRTLVNGPLPLPATAALPLSHSKDY